MIDLSWVRAEPIARLAQEWIQQHPGSSLRQLALQVSKTVRRMGYTRSFHSIQPFLAGTERRHGASSTERCSISSSKGACRLQPRT